VRRLRENRTLASRDEAEFSAFAARDGGQLLGFAFLLTGNRHDAEDLVQQALLRTAARWQAARQSPARYSRTVVLNLVRDRWRALQRQRTEMLSADLAALPSVADAAAVVLDRQVLLRACRLLPLQQRAVLVLRFWEDLSVEETAAVLGCTVREPHRRSGIGRSLPPAPSRSPLRRLSAPSSSPRSAGAPI
jgi:RNA polymerase sigma factor (sigma-70 family)